MTELEPVPQPTALARNYPPAPWTLRGSALLAMFAVRAADVAALVPPPLTLVTLPGGLATAYIAFGRYGPGSTLEYNEVIAGLFVRHGLRPGPCVTHIAADSLRSQQGSREIWRLPKQIYQFEWETDDLRAALRVWRGVTLVCSATEIPLNARMLPLRSNVPFLHVADGEPALLRGDFDLRVSRVPWELQIGPDGPLQAFAPVGRVFTSVARGSVTVQPLRFARDEKSDK